MRIMKTTLSHISPPQDSYMCNDFLQCLIPLCTRRGPAKMDPARITTVTRILRTSIMFFCWNGLRIRPHCVLDIYSSSSKEDFVSGIGAGCKLLGME
ncbi:hypothetical protein F4775DRAFT_547238 [Biscogniauxia sp. FL1348]|nr:hypothetical protein F4775DRAFT_547238 [Biscogniauxia sp. FL1348]